MQLAIAAFHHRERAENPEEMDDARKVDEEVNEMKGRHGQSWKQERLEGGKKMEKEDR